MRSRIFGAAGAAAVLAAGISGANSSPLTVTATGTNSATGQALAASATFAVSGTNLIVTLTNTSVADVLAPSDVLTALYFDISGNPTLTASSAVVAIGSSVFFGSTDPGSVVGGEWAYATGLSGTPDHQTRGISSSGIGGIFGSPDFPGSNLQGPAALDGLQYGITSAGDNTANGNSAVTGGNALIKNSVVFTLSGVNADFNPATLISNVAFQYGTSIAEPCIGTCSPPHLTTVVEPGSIGIFGAALLAFATIRTRRQIGA